MDEYLVDGSTTGLGTLGFRRGKAFSLLNNPCMTLREQVVLDLVGFESGNAPVRTLGLLDSMI